MDIGALIFILSTIGLYYFFKNYRDLKDYASSFFEIVGMAFILYLVSLLWKLFIYDNPTNFREVFINSIVFTRNILLASVGAYFLSKQNLQSCPLLLHFDENKKQWKAYLYSSIICVFLMIAISCILLVIGSNSVMKSAPLSISDTITLGFHAILVGVSEEIFYRLFLLACFLEWFKKTTFGTAWSIILSSSIWAFSHAGILETGGIKLLQIFLFGIILGALMIKKGWESCCFAHIIFNFIAYTLLSDFQIVKN